MEGSLCFNPSSGCNKTGKVLPIAEYDHTVGCSVTGGYMYRGSLYPPLQGHYFYGDFCTGVLSSLEGNSISGWNVTPLGDTPYSISTFGEDENGELYLADYGPEKSISYAIQRLQMCPPRISFIAILKVFIMPGSQRAVQHLQECTVRIILSHAARWQSLSRGRWAISPLLHPPMGCSTTFLWGIPLNRLVKSSTIRKYFWLFDKPL